jgi:hypothetical protein
MTASLARPIRATPLGIERVVHPEGSSTTLIDEVTRRVVLPCSQVLVEQVTRERRERDAWLWAQAELRSLSSGRALAGATTAGRAGAPRSHSRTAT